MSFTPSLHPRDFLGKFTGVGGSNKRLAKIHKSQANLRKAQSKFVATASVRTVGGGRRPLTQAEARKFLNDTNVSVNRVQGATSARRSAAKGVMVARSAHLKNFGRKPRPLPKVRNAGRRLR